MKMLGEMEVLIDDVGCLNGLCEFIFVGDSMKIDSIHSIRIRYHL